MSEEEPRGVLKSYLEKEGLLNYDEEGTAEIEFTHEDYEDRDIKGIFDYLLQTLVDFHSEEYFGRENSLIFDPENQDVEREGVFSNINLSDLTDSIMDIYGFEVENAYRQQALGNAFTYFINQMDEVETSEFGEQLRIKKGVGEETIVAALEEDFQS